jgi:uncharacterized membrane protein
VIREPLAEKRVGLRREFRMRGAEIGRFEGFSDAVFAFAVTLLVVSLEVPKTFTELVMTMRGSLAFAICFVILVEMWFEQYRFFRWYGLHDTGTLVLHSALLFVLLLYVYPLKFLFTLLINVWMGWGIAVDLPGGERTAMIFESQVPQLMIIYSAGFVLVHVIYDLLYLTAYRRRSVLELNAIEVFDTKTRLGSNLVNILVGCVSIALTVSSPRNVGWAGMCYWSLPILHPIYHMIRGRKRRVLEEAPGL